MATRVRGAACHRLGDVCVCPVSRCVRGSLTSGGCSRPFSDQQQASRRPLVLIAGFIHDVEGFLDGHPGGRKLLATHIGQDATTAFFGGVYDHSNAAHNVSTILPKSTRRAIRMLVVTG